MKRIVIKDNDAHYHCMSRTVYGKGRGSRIRFEDSDKEVLRRMIRKVADFSGVEVLTYCVMDNHFHVAIRVPMDARDINDTELVRRYSVLYPKPTAYQPMTAKTLGEILEVGGSEAEKMRQGLTHRMGDVSEYMRTLKQRFSVYFNRTHDRSGTLWAERFKSVLIEADRHALLAVAAYIDLNPVRAGIVKDPKDYRYCSYAEAVVGNPVARKGITLTLEGFTIRYHPRHLAHYRMALFGIGAYKNKENAAFISREEALRVLKKEKGKLSLSTLVRCRVRYFTDGLVLGSAEYVSSIIGKKSKKRSCTVPIEGCDESKNLVVGKGFRGAIVS